jgi:hypothetical protein
MDGMGEGEVAGRGYDYGRGEEARSISSSMAHFLLLPPFAIFFTFFWKLVFFPGRWQTHLSYQNWYLEILPPV